MTGWPVERVVASVTAVPVGKTEADRRRFDLVLPPREVSRGRTWLTTRHSTSREYQRATTTVLTESIRPVD